MRRFFTTARQTAVMLFTILCTVVGCASTQDRPPIPPGVNPDHLHFHDAVAEQGKPAPDFALPDTRTYSQVRLSELRDRPTVLIFGSCT